MEGKMVNRTAIVSDEKWHVTTPYTLGAHAMKVHQQTGIRFEATVYYNGNDSQVWVDSIAANGAIIAQWVIYPPARASHITKFDVGLAIDFRGADVLIGGTAHDLTTRDFIRWLARIFGAAPQDTA
jgi:hypothetical protein